MTQASLQRYGLVVSHMGDASPAVVPPPPPPPPAKKRKSKPSAAPKEST